MWRGGNIRRGLAVPGSNFAPIPQQNTSTPQQPQAATRTPAMQLSRGGQQQGGGSPYQHQQHHHHHHHQQQQQHRQQASPTHTLHHQQAVQQQRYNTAIQQRSDVRGSHTHQHQHQQHHRHAQQQHHHQRHHQQHHRMESLVHHASNFIADTAHEDEAPSPEQRQHVAAAAVAQRQQRHPLATASVQRYDHRSDDTAAVATSVRVREVKLDSACNEAASASNNNDNDDDVDALMACPFDAAHKVPSYELVQHILTVHNHQPLCHARGAHYFIGPAPTETPPPPSESEEEEGEKDHRRRPNRDHVADSKSETKQRGEKGCVDKFETTRREPKRTQQQQKSGDAGYSSSSDSYDDGTTTANTSDVVSKRVRADEAKDEPRHKDHRRSEQHSSSAASKSDKLPATPQITRPEGPVASSPISTPGTTPREHALRQDDPACKVHVSYVRGLSSIRGAPPGPMELKRWIDRTIGVMPGFVRPVVSKHCFFVEFSSERDAQKLIDLGSQVVTGVRMDFHTAFRRAAATTATAGALPTPPVAATPPTATTTVALDAEAAAGKTREDRKQQQDQPTVTSQPEKQLKKDEKPKEETEAKKKSGPVLKDATSADETATSAAVVIAPATVAPNDADEVTSGGTATGDINEGSAPAGRHEATAAATTTTAAPNNAKAERGSTLAASRFAHRTLRVHPIASKANQDTDKRVYRIFADAKLYPNFIQRVGQICFVVFRTPQDATAAQGLLRGRVLDGRALSVSIV